MNNYCRARRPCGRLRPALFFAYFYAFRTTFRWVYDKSSHHPTDHAGKAPEYRAFYGPKCVDFQYLFLCRSASLRRRIRLAQTGQYLARLDFGINAAPHSEQRFTSSRSFVISAHRAASSGRTAALNHLHSSE